MDDANRPENSPEPTRTEPSKAPYEVVTYDEFMHKWGSKTDRELLLEMLYGQHRTSVQVANLHALVEKIENEANATIEGMMSPDRMSEMARQFLGGS